MTSLAMDVVVLTVTVKDVVAVGAPYNNTEAIFCWAPTVARNTVIHDKCFIRLVAIYKMSLDGSIAVFMGVIFVIFIIGVIAVIGVITVFVFVIEYIVIVFNFPGDKVILRLVRGTVIGIIMAFTAQPILS